MFSGGKGLLDLLEEYSTTSAQRVALFADALADNMLVLADIS